MDTNGQSQGLTTKSTKGTKHTKYTKKEGRGGVRTTNGHEWSKAGVTTKDMKWHSQAFLGESVMLFCGA